MIHKLGTQHVEYIQSHLKIRKSQIYDIIKKPEQKSETPPTEGISNHLGGDDVKIWAHLIIGHNTPVSGAGPNGPLRTDQSKHGFYEEFIKYRYPIALDMMINHEKNKELITDIIRKHESQRNRFEVNICNLIAWKTMNDIKIVTIDDLKDAKKEALQVKFVCYETFYKHLADMSMKIVFDRQPYVCPTCQKTNDLSNTLQALRAKLTSDDTERLAISKDIKNIERAIVQVSLHKRQIEIQRDAVTSIKQNLDYSEVLVTYDFVTHSRIHQLIYVITFRNPDTNYEDWVYRSVFSKNKTNFIYIILAWELLFSVKTFDDYDTIFTTRDNGANFRSFAMVKYESQIGQRHGKILKVRSLAPHHAYTSRFSCGFIKTNF